jgi:hypothetical protein
MERLRIKKLQCICLHGRGFVVQSNDKDISGMVSTMVERMILFMIMVSGI